MNGELETTPFRHLLLLDKTLTAADEECASSEDCVHGVMKILDEEISTTCTTFYSPISGDNSLVLDIYSGHGRQSVFLDHSEMDLCYLLKASEHELGIPSSPVVGIFTTKGLCENSDLKFHVENWDFDDKFENYQQFLCLMMPWKRTTCRII